MASYSALEYPLRSVADKKKAVYSVTDNRVKGTKCDLRNVLNLVNDDRRIVGLGLLPFETKPMRALSPVGLFVAIVRIPVR